MHRIWSFLMVLRSACSGPILLFYHRLFLYRKRKYVCQSGMLLDRHTRMTRFLPLLCPYRVPRLSIQKFFLKANFMRVVDNRVPPAQPWRKAVITCNGEPGAAARISGREVFYGGENWSLEGVMRRGAISDGTVSGGKAAIISASAFYRYYTLIIVKQGGIDHWGVLIKESVL